MIDDPPIAAAVSRHANQLVFADVLVANKLDLADSSDVRQFDPLAGRCDLVK